MIGEELDDRALREAARLDAPAPPPAPELLAAVGAMKPVRPRTRFGGFAAVLAIGLVGPALTLLRQPWRSDLDALPPAWVALGAALWSVALLSSLAAALVPRRGDVLPSGDRAWRLGLASVAALLLFSAFGTARAPGVSLGPRDLHLTLLQSCVACGRYVLEVALVFLIAGCLALRNVLPIGGRRIGLALGAAGGAAAGLALHFHCPIASSAHLVLSHAGGMTLAAIAGALLVPLALGQRGGLGAER